MELTHTPVLAHEVVSLLDVQPSDWIFEGTFGRGGHTKLLLEQMQRSPQYDGMIFTCDRDLEAEKFFKTHFHHTKNVFFYHTAFSEIFFHPDFSQQSKKFDKIFLDLGVSSPQLDDPNRGFSFMKDGPLDMRMNRNQSVTAAEIVNTYDEANLAKIIFEFGEEKNSRQIAKAICMVRASRKIETTFDLKGIVEKIFKTSHFAGKHVATRTFQALRMEVNAELYEVEHFLPQAFDKLAIGGRMGVISFHSLEDRIVKKFFKSLTHPPEGDPLLRKLPMPTKTFEPLAKEIKPFPAFPTPEETQTNPRSRSAVFRVVQKLAEKKNS